MKRIPLNKGMFALVDDEDFDRLSGYRWFVNCNGYAIRKPPRVRRKERPTIHMHREVIGATGSIQVDHINLDRLDNRSSNLRLANNSQNHANRRAQSTNKLGVKGVRFDADRNKYRARAKLNGKEIHLGRFDSLDEAKAAYALAAGKLHGEFARAA